MLMTPFGKALRKASSSGLNSTPKRGGLSSTVLPMMRAGMRVAKRLVEGIIVRTHAQHDPKRCAANLADRPLSNDEAGAVVIQLLERVDGCGNVGNGAIEFLLGIGQSLAD